VSAALLVSTGWAADPVWNARDHIPLDRIAVQAHRGAGDLAPEGSLEAFELAWKLGCIPEADLRRTKDGVIVSFHDNNFARILPNAPEELKRKGVADLTFEEARELDVGSFRNPEFKGQRMISLSGMVQLLDLGCASFATDFPDAAMEAIRRYDDRRE